MYTERDLGRQELNQGNILESGKIPVGLGQLGILELERPHVLSIQEDSADYTCLLVKPK